MGWRLCCQQFYDGHRLALEDQSTAVVDNSIKDRINGGPTWTGIMAMDRNTQVPNSGNRVVPIRGNRAFGDVLVIHGAPVS
jgi:hypothetical protein